MNIILKYLNQIIVVNNICKIELDGDQIVFLQSDENIVGAIEVEKYDDNLLSIRNKYADKFDYKDLRYIRYEIARKIYDTLWEWLKSDIHFYDVDVDMEDFVKSTLQEFLDECGNLDEEDEDDDETKDIEDENKKGE